MYYQVRKFSYDYQKRINVIKYMDATKAVISLLFDLN